MTDSGVRDLQDLCNAENRGWPIPSQEHWHRLLLLLSGRRMFLKEFCNLSMLEYLNLQVVLKCAIIRN